MFKLVFARNSGTIFSDLRHHWSENGPKMLKVRPKYSVQIACVRMLENVILDKHLELAYQCKNIIVMFHRITGCMLVLPRHSYHFQKHNQSYRFVRTEEPDR